MAKISLGTAVTDSNGIARLVDGYAGTGAGEVDVSAEVTLSGSTFVSGTYPVLDCSFYDTGVTGTPNTEWWTQHTSFSLRQAHSI